MSINIIYPGKIIKRILICSVSLCLLCVLFTIPPATGALTSSDFSKLSHSDKSGDDYTFYWEGKASGFELEYEKSWGKKGKYPSIDIINLKATLNLDTVEVTMECAGNIELDYNTDYLVFFVENDHNPKEYSGFEPLLNPKDYKSSSISYEYMDASNCIVYFGYDSVSSDDYPDGNIYLPSLTGSVNGKTMKLTVSTEDLENAGVSTNSGFNIYGFANKLESGGLHYTYTWDSAGLGAVSAPANFDSEDSSGGLVLGFTCLVLIIVGIIVLVIVIIYFAKRRKVKSSQQPQQYPGQQYSPPPPPPTRPTRPTRPYSSPPHQHSEYTCSYCQQPLTFHGDYQKWYCDNCRRYV